MLTTLAPLTIANAGQQSGELGFSELRFIDSLTIFGPAALTGTVTVQVNGSRSGGSWVTLQSNGVDLEVAAGKAITIYPITALRLRLSSTLAEGAQRDFVLAARNCE